LIQVSAGKHERCNPFFIGSEPDIMQFAAHTEKIRTYKYVCGLKSDFIQINHLLPVRRRRIDLDLLREIR
jgi:hypothetical protein